MTEEEKQALFAKLAKIERKVDFAILIATIIGVPVVATSLYSSWKENGSFGGGSIALFAAWIITVGGLLYLGKLYKL